MEGKGDLEVVPTSKEGEVTKTTDEFDAQMKVYDGIKKSLGVITRNADEIDKMRDKDEKIADETERRVLMGQMDRILQETNSNAASVKKTLEDVKKDNEKFAEDKENSARVEMRQNLYVATVRKFANAMQQFNTANANFKQAIMDRQKRRLKHLDKNLDDATINKLVEEGRSQEVLDKAFITDDLRDCIAEIEQRHADVLRLELQVRQVYELFKDLAVLVDLQQDSLDIIEKHVHAAKDYAERGAVHIEKAEEYQKEARKRQCCIIMIVVGVLVVILAPILATQLNKA
jgi:syntaxin 1B/2/3